ncbi:MAG: NAD-glutamate dehydrogenase, partial [Bdellovibrionales bacterium]|nr:NAD-glutamate dehydrogenase [Bdellovibrionales bacterium]
KLDSQKIEIMPEPRPVREIFVSGPNLQGIHLRNGLIARGGLRWSDRSQDFRQEVLDLVKTQTIKNALIVPNGAKGGFVVRNLPEEPSARFEAGKSAYRGFIRSLLSVTDNRSGELILHPPRTVVYDGEDPYFVVAADKGTATFSDVANSIAVEEFSFWLGDAFASGGSEGYDHKVYGITARGAWESVKRHFNNIGLDYINETFTAIGIGDMSGDVFGNGLLLSDNVRLIAAFNHRHIFIDPDPDPKRSFNERKRLFELPRSTWSDYSIEALSSGGGVFERSSRDIPITQEIRNALGLPDTVGDTIDGEELIRHVLRAPVDLLWNGGIGTYVKARSESHTDVSDSTNDSVRINADELRAKVVGEGGNLGFTQRARVEFARIGGHI